jgi:hypothetical protein
LNFRWKPCGNSTFNATLFFPTIFFSSSSRRHSERSEEPPTPRRVPSSFRPVPPPSFRAERGTSHLTPPPCCRYMAKMAGGSSATRARASRALVGMTGGVGTRCAAGAMRGGAHAVRLYMRAPVGMTGGVARCSAQASPLLWRGVGGEVWERGVAGRLRLFHSVGMNRSVEMANAPVRNTFR